MAALYSGAEYDSIFSKQWILDNLSVFKNEFRLVKKFCKTKESVHLPKDYKRSSI